MNNTIIVHGSWKIADGDYVSSEKTYKELHSMLRKDEKLTVKGFIITAAVVCLPVIILILNVAAKIKV